MANDDSSRTPVLNYLLASGVADAVWSKVLHLIGKINENEKILGSTPPPPVLKKYYLLASAEPY